METAATARMRVPLQGPASMFRAASRRPNSMPTVSAAGLSARALCTFPKVSQKIQKTGISMLTPQRPPDYIRHTNDGGDAASDEEVRFYVLSLSQFKRAA